MRKQSMVDPQIQSFNEGVQELLRASECVPIFTGNDREAVYKLRYESYLRENAIAPNSSCRISDRFDDASNTLIFGIYIDGDLASSVRLSLSTSLCRDIPAMIVFSDALTRLTEPSSVILDPTRFVISEYYARKFPKLAYVTLRVAWLATEYFNVDYTLASVRPEHQAFYRRFYGHKVICEARPYPSLVKPLSLMLLDFRPTQTRGLQRYSFLHSNDAEKAKLFSQLYRVQATIAQVRTEAPTSLG